MRRVYRLRTYAADMRPLARRLHAASMAAIAAVDLAQLQLVSRERQLAADLALPVRWRARDRLREAEWPPADDLEVWRALGVHDAILLRPPAVALSLAAPSIAYQGGYGAILEAYLMDSPTTSQVTISAPINGVDPKLAAALVAAQHMAESLERDKRAQYRDGEGKQAHYVSSDSIAAEARRVLTENGLAWARIGVVFEPGKLGTTDLGNQDYVGDVVETWMLVHVSGATLLGMTRMAIIASKGRPHDKAVGAALTYDSGHTLRGLLCLDREDKHAPDLRDDDAAGSQPRSARQPQPHREHKPDNAPTQPAKNEKLERLRVAVDEKVGAYAAQLRVTKGVAWSKACELAGFVGPMGGEEGPFALGFEPLGKINKAIKDALTEAQREREPGDDAEEGAPF